MGYLDGEVALITAGGGGIAGACSQLFAKEGASVMLVDVNREAAEANAERVRAMGGDASASAANALVAADCVRVVQETIDRHGKLSVLLNLVGLFGKAAGGVDTVPLDEWDFMIDINLKSVFMMSKYAIPAMLQSGGGAIVNTGTLAAVIGRGGSPCYGTGKSGVLALTRAMAADYFNQNIRVNCVCPSATRTSMYTNLIAQRTGTGTALDQAIEDAKRSDQGLSTPEDIATNFLYLASDQLSRKVTGHILLADNGYSTLRL